MFFRQIFDVSVAGPLNVRSVKSKKYILTLQILSVATLLLMLGMQIYTIRNHYLLLASDSFRYNDLAWNAYNTGNWYPSEINLCDSYIFGNGLVNLFIVLIKLTGSIEIIKYINIVFTYVILFSCVYIIRKIFGKTETEYWFITLYCLFGTFWGEVLQPRTELPFMALAFAALALLMSGKAVACAAAGVLLALANWTRPLGSVFFITGIWLLVNQRAKLKKYLCFVLCAAATVGVIGSAAYIQSGRFVYQATTGGYNLIMGANDLADGTSNYDVFNKKGASGYLSYDEKTAMTYEEQAGFYKSAALDWIKKNPGKYLALMPKKLFTTLYSEGYSLGTYYDDASKGSGSAFYKELFARLTGQSDEKISSADIIVIWTQGIYMITLAAAFVCVIHLLVRRRIAVLMPFVFAVAGTVGVTMLLVGGPRYHFPVLPLFIMAAAILFQSISCSLSERKNRQNL